MTSMAALTQKHNRAHSELVVVDSVAFRAFLVSVLVAVKETCLTNFLAEHLALEVAAKLLVLGRACEAMIFKSVWE
jgi:hypothetical protein